MGVPRLLSRIVYTSIYVVLCSVLTALLLVVPGDFINQVLHTTHQLINLIIVAIVYVLALLIVLFVYFLRLYITRSNIAAIPKAYVPIEKGDVGKEVRAMIVHGLARSAAIAWEARPKVVRPVTPADDMPEAQAKNRSRRSLQIFRSKTPATVEDELGIAALQPNVPPVWGEIEHDGWGSPASPDLPNLQYSTVLAELPNLVEAKAVAQSPAAAPISAAGPPTLDAEAVALLQRAPNMTLRDYITHLTTLDVLSPSAQITEFLDTYERARFAGRPLSNAAFRTLMHHFAAVLRGMQPLDPARLYEFVGGPRSSFSGASTDGGHIDDDAPRDTTPTTPARSFTSSSRSTTRSSRFHAAVSLHQYRTAPNTPKSRRPLSTNSSDTDRFAHARRPYALSTSSSSLTRTISQASQGSVIRLASREDSGELPYVLRLTDTL
ncbi:sucrase/ferredoxin domain-containing protein [Xylariomycetidae sp. FL0641]|nr:sucrase/ferredoxin domain-containing protein [Xylariomycetidae sp. FL0641]